MSSFYKIPTSKQKGKHQNARKTQKETILSLLQTIYLDCSATSTAQQKQKKMSKNNLKTNAMTIEPLSPKSLGSTTKIETKKAKCEQMNTQALKCFEIFHPLFPE